MSSLCRRHCDAVQVCSDIGHGAERGVDRGPIRGRQGLVVTMCAADAAPDFALMGSTLRTDSISCLQHACGCRARFRKGQLMLE